MLPALLYPVLFCLRISFKCFEFRIVRSVIYKIAAYSGTKRLPARCWRRILRNLNFHAAA